MYRALTIFKKKWEGKGREKGKGKENAEGKQYINKCTTKS